MRSIGNPLAVFDDRTTAGVMIACGKTLDDKKDLLRRYLRAWKKSVDFAQAHTKFTKSMLPKYTSLTPEVINAITIPTFTTRLEPRAIGKFIKSMQKYGWIKGTPPSYDQLVWNGK